MEKLRLDVSMRLQQDKPIVPFQRNGALQPLFVPPTKSKLQGMIDEAKSNKSVHGYSEISRICKLPIAFQLTPEEVDAVSKENIIVSKYNDGFRLFERQAAAILDYETYGRVFCPIGVGWGKTLISILIASKAFEKGLKKILLLVPAQVYAQFALHDLALARSRVPVRCPFILLGNTSSKRRLALAKSNRPGCYVLPYSCLSTKDSIEVLLGIMPQCIIADEAHNLASRRAARTRRIVHYLEDQKPEFIPLSGTMTGKSIMDYHHLIRYALGDMNPLPNSPQMASDWGQFIDAKAEFTGASTGPIKAVVDWAKLHFPENDIPNDVAGFRSSYRLRLTSAPGVVATSDSEIGCSLYLSNVPAPCDKESEGWKKLETLMDDVSDRFLTPNGDQIEHAMHGFKWLFELSAGFYNELVWPTVEELQPKYGARAQEVLDAALDHHDLKQIFAQTLRKWLSNHHKANLDTPLLVRSNMANNRDKDVGKELYSTWVAMRDAEFPNMPERYSRCVRVYDFKIKAAVEWAWNLPPDTGAILWCYNQEIARWLAEELPEALYCPAGEQYNKIIVNHKNKDKVIIASMPSHGQGKNLQHFQHQYFVQWPRVAKMAEQVLGRLHRNGQTADELIAVTSNTTMFDMLNFAACLNDALYIHQTTGNRQKLIYSGYDPLPMIFPPQVLRERGLDNKMLTTEQQQIMQELFGKPKT